MCFALTLLVFKCLHTIFVKHYLYIGIFTLDISYELFMLSYYPILRLQNDFLQFLQVNYPQELAGQSIACAVLSACCKSSGLLFTIVEL